MQKPHCNDYRLLLASSFNPDYVREIANAFAKSGLRVKLIGGNIHANNEYEPGVEFVNLRGDNSTHISFPINLYRRAAYFCKLIKYVAHCKTPLVYDLGMGLPFLRCFLYSILRIMGKPILYTVHNVLPHDSDSLKNRVIYFVVYRVCSNYLIVHGESLKERLVSEFGVSDKKIVVAPIGSLNPPDNPAITKGEAMRSLGIANDEFVLLSFGLQRYYKGTHFLLRALSEYKFRRFRLLIRGDSYDAKYCEMLKDIIEGEDFGNKVDCSFGYVSDQQMELVFKAADIVLLPYFEGSQSAVKLTAYSYGRPVLISDIGSLGEYVVPGVTGETFAVQDSDSLLMNLEKMRINLPAYNERAIKEYLSNNLSWNICVDKVNKICERLC